MICSKVYESNRVPYMEGREKILQEFQSTLVSLGPILQDQMDPYWLEVARRLHNKGVRELLFFWDENSKDWKIDPRDSHIGFSL